MAKVGQVLGVDIGTHSIRVAEVALTPAGVDVRKLAEARLVLEAGQKESERQASIAAQLNGLLKTHKFKARHAVFCVPGQTVFVRRLRLPATTPERMSRIIRFEAREQIPFPLEKTVLEYQVFPSDTPNNEVEVLLVAMKREFVDSFMKMVRRTGLNAVAIAVSSLALHNFHELNGTKRPIGARAKAASAGGPDQDKGARKWAGKGFLSLQLGRRKKPAAPEAEAAGETAPFEAMELEEIQAQINLGASIMDLAIPKAGPSRLIGFTRSVPVAGNQMDREVRSRLGLESLDEARRVKEESAAILAQDFELAGDPKAINRPASEAATAVADRMIAEIRRSLDFFISQPDGVAVDSIVLSGGLARMPYLSNYIEEKMGVPVTPAEVRSEQISVSEELAPSIPSFAVPLGLAFQGIGVSQIQIDFLPQEVKDLRSFAERKVQLAATTLLLAGTVFYSTQLGGRYLQVNRGLAEQYGAFVAQERQRTNRINAAEKTNQELASQFEALVKGQTNRYLWLEFLYMLVENRPSDTVIERITLPNNGRVEIAGLSSARASVMDLLNALENQPAYVGGTPRISALESPRRDPRFRTDVIPFALQLASFDRSSRHRSVKRSSVAKLDESGQLIQTTIDGVDLEALNEMMKMNF